MPLHDEYARHVGHADLLREADDGLAGEDPPGKEITWGEVHVGARQVFQDAGFKEVSRPTVRRAVMRIDFEQHNDARTPLHRCELA